MYTTEEENAIFNYVSETPPSINKILRGEQKIKKLKELKEYVTLIQAFRKTKSEKELTLYRGIDPSYLPNSENFTILSLISTMEEIGDTFDFTDENNQIILKINIPVGVPIIDIHDINIKYHDEFPDSGREIILLPGKINITDIETINDKYGNYSLISCNYEILESVELIIERILSKI